MPRGPEYELHYAARDGSIERTRALLSRGSIDIDERDPTGWTPLKYRYAVSGALALPVSY